MARSCSSRLRPRWSCTRAGIPAFRAWFRPAAAATLEITTATRPPRSPVAAASSSACRLLPRPLMSTPTLRMETTARSLQDDAGAALDVPDHEARLAAPFQRVFHLVEVAGRRHDHHADAHVERAVHLLIRDLPGGLDEAEKRGHQPGGRADARAEAGGQHAGHVAGETAAGDVDQGADLAPLQQRLERGEVTSMRREQGAAHG